MGWMKGAQSFVCVCCRRLRVLTESVGEFSFSNSLVPGHSSDDLYFSNHLRDLCHFLLESTRCPGLRREIHLDLGWVWVPMMETELDFYGFSLSLATLRKLLVDFVAV
jgi:hypothetical protein